MNSNPLQKYFRQPKLYVSLPSKGAYLEPDILKGSAEDMPVFAMTCMDEILLKTPDALFNGESTAKVIQSCCPHITDGWKISAIDLDSLLIAIRIATYGENMGVEANCPHCEHLNEYDIDLVKWLDTINAWKFKPEVDISPLTIHVRPYTYKELSQTSLKTLEHQRIFNVINNEEMSDEDKIERFGKSFVKLTELTVDIIAGCVAMISTPDGNVTDQEQIQEFIRNSPKDVFDKISEHINDMKKNIELPTQHVACNECGKEFDMPVTMDQSNFFAVRS